MVTRELSVDDALKLVQNGAVLGSPVRLSSGQWGAELKDENHDVAEEGTIVIISTSKGTHFDAMLNEKVFSNVQNSASHWRITPCADIPKDADQSKPDCFGGTPVMLPDRTWGVKIITSHRISVSDSVEVTPRRGKPWVTKIVEQVGENLYRTEGRNK